MGPTHDIKPEDYSDYICATKSQHLSDEIPLHMQRVLLETYEKAIYENINLQKTCNEVENELDHLESSCCDLEEMCDNLAYENNILEYALTYVLRYIQNQQNQAAALRGNNNRSASREITLARDGGRYPAITNNGFFQHNNMPPAIGAIMAPPPVYPQLANKD